LDFFEARYAWSMMALWKPVRSFNDGENPWISKIKMDINNPVIQLCMEGTRAEFAHRVDDARLLYQQAWEARLDDYDACIAAHYVARFQESPEESLRWNQIALEHANTVNDEKVKDFRPSLYLSLGHAHEILGNQVEAKRYYNLAADLGYIHQRD
jgi:hypothetical protein